MIIVGLLYGGYRYYSRKEPELLAKTEKNIFDFLAKTADNVSQTLREKAEEKKREFLESTEQAAKDYAQEKAAEIVFGLGEELQSLAGSIKGQDSSQAENPPTAIVIKKDVRFSISVQGSSYSVDWGDGQEERNVLLNGREVISHSWSTEGDYLVKIEVTENGAVHSDSFPVRVISQ